MQLIDHIYRVLRPSGRSLTHVSNGGGVLGVSMRYADITHELASHLKVSGKLDVSSAFPVFTSRKIVSWCMD